MRIEFVRFTRKQREHNITICHPYDRANKLRILFNTTTSLSLTEREHNYNILLLYNRALTVSAPHSSAFKKRLKHGMGSFVTDHNDF